MSTEFLPGPRAHRSDADSGGDLTIDRRGFLFRAGQAAVGLSLAPGRALFATSRFDLVIRGGLLLDGTGAPAERADVGLVGDSIRAIGTIDPEQGRHHIDATGLHVAPGFIDIHSHSDDSILRYPGAESRVLQGITTEITGNCGYSAAPLTDTAQHRREDISQGLGIEVTWSDVASYFRVLEELGLSVNQALLLGQGALRENIVGEDDRQATNDEIAELRRAVEEGMAQGAWGLSTGLEYAPGIFTPTAEIVEMTSVVARRGGLYASHMRNEEADLLAAVDEAIDIGRRTGTRLQVSHLKAAGRPNWHLQQPAIERIERARQDGVDVFVDAYPYGAYSTGLTILLPPWARDGGTDALLERLADSTSRERILAALPERIAVDPGGPELIQISAVRTEVNRRFVGRTLEDVARAWDTDAAHAVVGLLRQEEAGVGYIGFAMSDENVDRVLSHPMVMIGSDGVSMAPEGPAANWQPHPRSYGTCPRVLGRFARERGVFDLPTAVAKMTSMPAAHVGLADRGRLDVGKKADLVLFDAATVADEATFEDPHRYPVGIRHVLVNGETVVENGTHTGTRPGRVLRR